MKCSAYSSRSQSLAIPAALNFLWPLCGGMLSPVLLPYLAQSSSPTLFLFICLVRSLCCSLLFLFLASCAFAARCCVSSSLCPFCASRSRFAFSRSTHSLTQDKNLNVFSNTVRQFENRTNSSVFRRRSPPVHLGLRSAMSACRVPTVGVAMPEACCQCVVLRSLPRPLCRCLLLMLHRHVRMALVRLLQLGQAAG